MRIGRQSPMIKVQRSKQIQNPKSRCMKRGSKESHYLFRARIINPVSRAETVEWKNGGILVDEKGKIIACGSYNSVKEICEKDCREVHFKDQVIIPGLIDCHLHMPQLDQRGKHGATLLNWLQKYIYPAEKAFKNLSVVEDVAKRFFKKLILNGVTTSSVYVTVHPEATDLAFEIAKETGLRVAMGKVMMDQNAPTGLGETTASSLKNSLKLYEKWHGKAGGKLLYVFTPRFGPTCSEKLWKKLGGLMKETMAYLQTHISETVSEVEAVREIYPQYMDYTDLLEKNDCLTPRTILAHAIYVSPSECRRIARADAKIVHCPTSNLFLKSGRMPIEMIEAAGITYGLGTDVGAGTSMSLFTCMRHADYIQPKISVSPVTAFYSATLGGAKVLSLGNKIGNFEKGKRADFCVVDIKEIDPRYRLKDLSMGEVLSLLMYRGYGNVIRHTFVDGKKLDVDSINLKNDRLPVGYA